VTRRNRRKEKEIAEKVVVEKKSPKKLLSVLPLEASAVGILLLIILTSFYVVSMMNLCQSFHTR
jgi:dolichyl-diphosphooligosaccharide--protein glycosyltransferase